MTIPNKTSIIDNIASNLPQDLLESKIWLAYYYKKNKNGTYTKPPCTQQGHSVDAGKEGVSFFKAVEDGYPGIKINPQSDLIAFDIDDKDAKLGKCKFSLSNIPSKFQEFMAEYDSYTEISPSQCGLRILMRCKNKSELPGRAILNEKLCIGGELFMNSGFVTITGNQIAGTDIKSIDAKDLRKWFENKKENKVPSVSGNVVGFPNVNFDTTLPPLNEFLEALKCCYLDQRERVKTVYKTVTGQNYNHYDYWLKIMMASFDYAVKTKQFPLVTNAVVTWSSTDKKSFQSDSDVLEHWNSIEASYGQKVTITYSTLFKFAKMLRFEWPREAYDKQGNPTGKPLVNDGENFKYLLEYNNIKIYRDIFDNRIYIKADKDILKKHFGTTVIKTEIFGMRGPFELEHIGYKFWELCQDNGYINITYSTIAPLFKSYAIANIKPINMLKMWLDTPPEELSKDMVEKNTDLSKSNLDYLMSCIKFNDMQDVGLAKKYFDTFFFEMMMPIYNPKRILSHRSFMLVMTGPENCRKTTFFSMLFPANLRRQFVTNTTETLGGAKSIRDFATSLVTSALVVADEFEIFYNKKNDSLFKTYVTSDVIDYVPIYEKTMRKEFKNAVLAGTTNRRSLAFEQDSNRRLAMIDVSFIDTSAMECINWHYFYRNYVSRGKAAMALGKHLWKLSDEVIKEQYKVNEEFRSQSNLEIILRETFDFDMDIHDEVIEYDKVSVQYNKELFKMSDILGAIRQRYPTLLPKPAELKHLLKRLCGNYTHTTNKTIKFGRYAGYIKSGIIKQGQWTKYVMPPIKTDFE